MATATKRETQADLKKASRSGTALMQWRRKRRINRSTFAKLANCSERKLATYEKAPKIPAPIGREVTEVLRLLDALSEFVPDEELGTWLETPNPGFDRRKPIKVIEAGETDLLWEMIHQTRHGAYG